MTKRIFIALPLPSNLQEKITAWSKKVKKLPVRFIEPKNLHITIIPPWYESNIKEIENRLTSFEKSIGKIKIKFHHISFGPHPQNPRLIWIVGDTPPQLIILKEKIEKVLALPKENRPFKTHVTIARFSALNFKYFPIKKLNEKVDWEVEIEELCLMESKLSKEGADYEVIKKIPL